MSHRELKVKTIERGIQQVITDRFLDASVYINDDAFYKATVIMIKQRLFDWTVYKDTVRTDWQAAPGLWNALKRFIPFMTPKQVPMLTTVHLHHNCPHLPTMVADQHFAWLTQDVEKPNESQ